MEVKYKDGSVRDVPSHEAALALASGEGEVRTDAKIPITDPDGNVAEVDPQTFLRGMASGDYTPMGEASYQLYQRQKSAGVREMAEGVGLGIADKMSLGALPAAAVYLGGEDARQNILAMREMTPGAVTAGEVIGMVAPAMFAGGRGFAGRNAPGYAEPLAAGAESWVARGASGIRSGFQATPSGMVARAGNAVEGMVSRGLASRFGEPTTFLGAAAQRGAAMAAGGATEGAIWGAATQLTEDSLYNRPLSAESLMWGNHGASQGLSRGKGVLGSLLWGGVAGGAIGGGMGGGGYLARKGVDAARREGTSLLGRAMGIPNGSPEEISAAWTSRMAGWMDDVATKHGAKAMGADRPIMAELHQLGERQPGARRIYDQFAAGELPFQRGKGQPWSPEAALSDLKVLQRAAKDGFDEVDATAERLLQADPKYRAILHRSDAVRAGLPVEDTIFSQARPLYEDLNRLTVQHPQAAEYKAFFEAMSKDSRSLGGLSIRNLRAYRKIARNRYEGAAFGSEESLVWAKTTEFLENEVGSIAARMEADVPGFAQQYQHLKDIIPAVKILEKGLLGKMAKEEAASMLDSYSTIALLWGGPVSSAAMAVARKSAREYGDSAIAAGARWASRKLSPREEALAAVERSTRNTEAVVNKAVGSFIGGMRRAASGTAAAASATSRVAARMPQKSPALGGAYADKARKDKEAQLTNAEIQKRAKAIQDKLAKVSADPNEMLNDIETLAGPLAYHAPGVYGELSGTMARAYDVLRKYAPVSRGGANYLLAHQDPKTIDPDQARKLVKVAAAIDDPIMVLDKMGVNGLSPEELDAIKTVYPQVFSLIQERILDELTNGDVHPTYEEKITLTLMTGVPADYSMTKTAILASQMTYKPAEKIETRAVESDTPKRPLDLASDMRTEITIQEAGGRF